jgi:uncharacterized protein
LITVNSSLKKLLLPFIATAVLIAAALSACAAQLPDRPQGPIGDNAAVLDAAVISTISQISRSLWEQAGFGLVVATVASLGDEPIETYAASLYEKWGVGAKGADEGALILLSLNPRRVRIEVGYGAEGYLNDAKAGRLLDMYGMPYFKTGDYSRGFLAVSTEIARIVAAEKRISLTLPADNYPPRVREGARKISPLSVFFFIIIFFLLVSTRFGRSLLFWFLLSALSSGGRGGGFGGGFGGGGFGGGFGGGRSGGGGASRSF